jgi:hypothetical protein
MHLLIVDIVRFSSAQEHFACADCLSLFGPIVLMIVFAGGQRRYQERG